MAGCDAPSFSASVFVSLSNDRREALERRKALAAVADSTPRMLADDLLYVVGTQNDLVRALTRLAGLGVDRVHIGAMPPDPHDTLDLVAELLPSVRALCTARETEFCDVHIEEL